MILAYPINKKGDPIGGERSFSEEQWARMQKIPNLRWKVLPDLEDEYSYDNLNKMTKRQLINSFDLPIGDIKLTKSEIIEKIT